MKKTGQEDDTFAIRLLRAQSAAGINQYRLGKITGLDHGHLNHLQSGKSEPNLKTLVKLAQALNVSTDYLCGLKEQS